MTKRTLQQIEQSLRKKLAEAGSKDLDNDGVPDESQYLPGRNPYDPLNIGGRETGGPLNIDIGLGGAGGGGGARVWRVPGKPTSQTSPRIDKEIASAKAREKELGPVKDPVDATARIIARQRAEMGRPPREPSADKPSLAPQPQTPTEKLIAQAQQQAKQTGEPTVAITEPRVAKILDRLFPEPKTTAKVEPALRPPSKEAERQEKLQQLRQREAERQQQKQADKQPQPAPAPTANASKTSTRTDAEIVDKPTFTSPQAWYKKLATEKGVDAAEKYRTYYTGSTGNEKLPSWGSHAYTAGKTGTAGAIGYGAYELLKPDEKPADTVADKPGNTVADKPATTDKVPGETPPAKDAAQPRGNSGEQSALPQDGTSTQPPANIRPDTTTTEPPPLQPYPPGTKFPKDEILQRQDRFRASAFAEAYSKVLHKYKNFLNEETEQEKRYRERLQALQLGIYGQESRSGKARTNKPNYAGALGPMQIMPKTFQWMKDTKIIPKDFDIKNPEQNKEAGNALIAHYYKKYEGDPAKVAAAYYAGPGAIRKDGTINTHWRDRKNPKAPDVGQYINQTLSRAGLADVTYTAAPPAAKPDTKLAAAPVQPVTVEPKTADKLEPSVDVATAPEKPLPVAKTAFKDVFDYEAFDKASKAGQDLSDISKFMKGSAKTTAAGLSERYMRFKKAVTR